jgi:hypothetical protein
LNGKLKPTPAEARRTLNQSYRWPLRKRATGQKREGDEMTVTSITPVLIAAGLFIYMGIYASLQRAAQPLRMRIIDIGNELLRDPNVPGRTKRYVSQMSNLIFTLGARRFAVLFIIPFILILDSIRGKKDKDRIYPSSKETKIKLLKIEVIHIVVSWINHPIIMSIIIVEILIFGIIGLIIGSFLRGVIQFSETWIGLLQGVDAVTRSFQFIRVRHR